MKGSKNGKKAGPFKWPEKARGAFRQLRDAFTTAPILAHFNPELKTRVETDAFDFALAGIIL